MDIAPLNQKTGYVRWNKAQGLPIHIGHGMADLRALEVRPYGRLGGQASLSLSRYFASLVISSASSTTMR